MQEHDNTGVIRKSTSRRTFIKGGLVAAACSPAPAIAPENPLPDIAELPVDKVHRIAEELAHALDEWNAGNEREIHGAGRPGIIWSGHLLPQRAVRLRLKSENLNTPWPKGKRGH